MEDEYDIIESDKVSNLKIKVNEKRKDGWRIVGGMTSYVRDHFIQSSSFNGAPLQKLRPINVFCQTIVKVDENTKKEKEY